MNDAQDNAEMRQRLHSALDPLIPDPGARDRVLAGVRERLRTRGSLPAWDWRTSPRRVRGGLAVLSAVAVIGGAFALGLGLRAHSHPITSPTASIPVLLQPPATTPASQTSVATPAAIASVRPTAVSFANASDGWALGSGCDAQQRCQVSIARTTTGGATWSLTGTPTGLSGSDALQITAGSNLDAWVWGNSASNQPVFVATHDGGHSWQPDNPATDPVVAIAVADGTVWAWTACPLGSDACAAHLMSAPVGGGSWTDLGAVPAAVQRPPLRGPGVPTASLIRTGARAWIVGSNQVVNSIARSDDGGRHWLALTVPCLIQSPEMYLAASSSAHVMLVCTATGGLPAPQEVWSSTDGGSHWMERSREWLSQYSPPRPDIGHIGSGGYPDGLVVVSQTTAWMMQGREDNLVTHDDGRTWAHAALPQQYFGDGGGAGGLVFTDQLHGWTFTTAGLWATADGGVHWQYQAVIGRVPGY